MDQEAGRFSFTWDDGCVATAELQIIGLLTPDSTWLWAWSSLGSRGSPFGAAAAFISMHAENSARGGAMRSAMPTVPLFAIQKK